MGTDKRFSITMSDDLYQQVDEFRHENKYATQTKAIAYLVQQGLRALRGPLSNMASGATEALQASSFRSLETILNLPEGSLIVDGKPIITEDEMVMLSYARLLNFEGRKEAEKRIQELTYVPYYQKEKSSNED